jgi:uncharacterized protein YbaR (Trm112 family)
VHILMTDILTCPRCGPRFGLILLADRMRERRVLDGALGCSNCREKYPVRDGIVDFTTAGVPAVGVADAAAHEGGDSRVGNAEEGVGAEGGDGALRLAALMGVTAGPGYVLLAGAAAAHAGAISGFIEDVEVVTVSASAAASSLPVAPGSSVSRLAVAAALPLADARMAGVVLAGDAADALLEEGARVLSPLGRLVVEPAPADAASRLEAAGLRVLVQEGATLIAVNQHAGRGR